MLKKILITASLLMSALIVVANDSIKADTNETTHLHSVRLMDMSIEPSKDGCRIFDLSGNKLNFPSVSNEKLLIERKVAFTDKCLSFDIRK